MFITIRTIKTATIAALSEDNKIATEYTIEGIIPIPMKNEKNTFSILDKLNNRIIR